MIQKEKKMQLRAIVGKNIRTQRLARGLSIDELAKLLDLTPGYMGLIERGERGTNAFLLLQFSKIFEVSVDTLLNKEDESPFQADSEIDTRIKNINSYISVYNESDLDFIIDVIKSYYEVKKR